MVAIRSPAAGTWGVLPGEVQQEILLRAEPAAVEACAQTCRILRQHITPPAFTRRYLARQLPRTGFAGNAGGQPLQLALLHQIARRPLATWSALPTVGQRFAEPAGPREPGQRMAHCVDPLGRICAFVMAGAAPKAWFSSPNVSWVAMPKPLTAAPKLFALANHVTIAVVPHTDQQVSLVRVAWRCLPSRAMFPGVELFAPVGPPQWNPVAPQILPALHRADGSAFALCDGKPLAWQQQNGVWQLTSP